MIEFFFKVMIIIFGVGFLMFLGAFIFDHYWFKIVVNSRKGRRMAKEELVRSREKSLEKYYEEHPQERTDVKSR